MAFLSWFRRAPPNPLETLLGAAVHKQLPYRLSTPGAQAAVPLIIYLHGAGGAGTDNRSHLERGNGYALTRLAQTSEPAFLLAPQCPRDQAWWSPTDQPSRYGDLLLELLDKLCQTLPIDPDRLYLLGPSMGGHGVWDLGWRNPDRWAALVPVCGAIAPHRTPPLAATPTWCFHGALDTDVPVEGSRRATRDLQALNAPIRYTELAGIGHNCTREVFSRDDLIPWLLRQRRPAG